jgi:two-component system, cell cycle sensor histidine kinase and response regulator CckA
MIPKHSSPLYLLLFLLLFSPVLGAEQVLILHSYHHGYRWTDSIHDGIMEVMESRPGTELFVTHMDAKYFSDPALLNQFEDILRRQYQIRFDAIICTDDPALDFILERRDRLFPGIPLVFCGVNGFEPSRLAGQEGITGVNEEISVSETLDAILQILPSTRRVAVVGDVSQAGTRNLQLVREAEDSYGDRLDFEYHRGPAPGELRRILWEYRPGTVVLYVSYLQTSAGQSLGLHESLELVTSSSPVPVFGFWDFMLGHGVAGGMLVSGRAQGIAAARLTGRILEGESPDDLPVVMDSPNEFLFDHSVLSRFGLDVRGLPGEVTIVNQPRSFWRENRRLLLHVLFFLTVETALLIWLFISRSLLRKTKKTLAESEERWRTYITEAPLAVFLCDRGGDYLDVNPEACRMTGYGREELLAMNLRQMLPPESLEGGKRHFEKVRETGHSDGVLLKVRKDGTPYWTRVQAVRLSDDRFLAFTQDITAAREAETSVREARDQWERTFDAVPDLIFLIDPEFRILKANRSFLDRLGKGSEEILGRHCFDVVRGVQAPHSLCPNLQTLEDRRGHSQELHQERLNGDFLVTTTPLHDGEGNFLGSVHVARDITELKKYEQILVENAKRLRLAQEVSGLGSWEVELSTMNRWLSDEVFHIFGLSPEEGLPSEEAYNRQIHPADFPLWERTFEKLKSGQEAEVVIRVYRSCDGELVYTEVRGVPQFDDSGRVIRLFGTLRDITDRVKAEEERLRMERQIQQTQKLESLGVLAGGIAHDFNNLLMAILGYADLSLTNMEVPVPAPVRKNLEEITSASRRASDLCRQMLAYAGRGRFEEELFRLDELVEEMTRLLASSISKKIRLQIHHGPGLPSLKGDPTQIRQVVMNLVINASEAVGDQEGVVTVSTSLRHCTPEDLFNSYLNQNLLEGDYLCLEVTDTGSGMDQHTLERLFEPFFTTKFTGRGLGMSAVLGIVRGHGGSLSVKSKVGGGSTFTIYLPPEEAVFPEPVREEPDYPPDWKGEGTVLLVEDEESIRTLGTLMLEQLGFEVVTAEDGVAALEIYRREGSRFSLVLLDLTMPRMGGAETFRAIREINPDVQVLIASGFSAQEMEAQFEGQGLLGFIEKPFTLDTLRNIISRGSGSPGR